MLVLASFACTGHGDEQATLPNLGYRSDAVRIASSAETAKVHVELATNAAQRTMGLMERRSLADTAGMLFLYDTTQPPDAGFWMYRTRIPLDIAYIDSAGVIRAIVAMKPCPAVLIQGCPSYPGGTPFRAALEVNAGYFLRHRITVGDRVMLADTASARLVTHP